jgi:hypothetical protein
MSHKRALHHQFEAMNTIWKKQIIFLHASGNEVWQAIWQQHNYAAGIISVLLKVKEAYTYIKINRCLCSCHTFYFLTMCVCADVKMNQMHANGAPADGMRQNPGADLNSCLHCHRTHNGVTHVYTISVAVNIADSNRSR